MYRQTDRQLAIETRLKAHRVKWEIKQNYIERCIYCKLANIIEASVVNWWQLEDRDI